MTATTDRPAALRRPGLRAVLRPESSASIALGLAGVAFAAYPVLRGYGPETGADGAALYARAAWLLAHVLGMAGFALLATGLGAIDVHSGRWATWGAFLVLPYYGAEAFGLHALGIEVLRTGHSDMTTTADTFRYHPVALTAFLLGWAVLAGVGVRLAGLARRADGATRWGLALTAAALVTYLPQFFLPAAGRIAHGIVLAVGLGLLAVGTGGVSAGARPLR